MNRMMMSRAEYLEKMCFSPKWSEYGLIPDTYIDQLRAMYEPGMENASEHDRNGLFHWWLKRSPSKEVLIQLVHLSYLDADQLMAEDVRSYIVRSVNYDKDVAERIRLHLDGGAGGDRGDA